MIQDYSKVRPNSPAFKVLAGSSVIVSQTGTFSNSNLTYTYAQSEFAINGLFDDKSNMIKGKKFRITSKTCDTKSGMMKLNFSKLPNSEHVYHYRPPTKASFGDQPNVVDELAEEYVKCKDSHVHMEGIFAKRNIPKVSSKLE